MKTIIGHEYSLGMLTLQHDDGSASEHRLTPEEHDAFTLAVDKAQFLDDLEAATDKHARVAEFTAARRQEAADVQHKLHAEKVAKGS